jgi:DNA-binding LytR/AlgR family response regulator
MNPEEREYKCFIVDDNKLDRLTTVSFTRKYSFLKIEGVFDSPRDALKSAEKTIPDVILLDIHMPETSGLELREKLEKVPACIFTTAYPDYALSCFDANALDFLTKPLHADRFDKAMKRLQYFLDIHYKATLSEHSFQDDSLFIKDGHTHVKIKLHDIIHLEALKDYTGIITKERKYCILKPLGNLLKEKDFQNFIRIHRSYAVQKQFIRKVNSSEVMVDNILLPVGRSYKEVLNALLIQ